MTHLTLTILALKIWLHCIEGEEEENEGDFSIYDVPRGSPAGQWFQGLLQVPVLECSMLIESVFVLERPTPAPDPLRSIRLLSLLYQNNHPDQTLLATIQT